MNKTEKDIWFSNIENATNLISDQYGPEEVQSILQRYDVTSICALNSCYYSDVLYELELIANNN